jgi:hypothetical protein
MTKSMFYARLSTVLDRRLTPLELTLLDLACGDTEPDDVEFILLPEVATRLAEGAVGHWLYDRRTKTWLINLPAGIHVHLMGVLYGIYTEVDLAWDTEVQAERYIEEHYGFFLSGFKQ